MAKRCTKCGNFMMDDERFCPNCGENAQNAAVSQPAAPAAYQQPQASYQQPQPTYQQPYPSAIASAVNDEDIMTLGKWVGTIVVTTFFGLISLIFLFIWGFGDGPEARRRYCKAMLIVTAIGIGVGIVIWLVVFGMAAAVVGGAAGSYNYNDWTSYTGQMAAAVSMMIR